MLRETLAGDATRGLQWWTGLPGNPNRGGVLVYGGIEAREIAGLKVLPWNLG